MIRAVPSALVHALFAAGLIAATFPAWRMLLLGFDPSLDELLRLRCLGP